MDGVGVEVPQGTVEAYCSDCDSHIEDHRIVVAARWPAVIADSLPHGKKIAHAIVGHWCGPVLVRWHGARWLFCRTRQRIVTESVVLADDGHRWIHWIDEQPCDDVEFLDQSTW